jgi:sugar O-acyltransferase (sialic acid O-acetyltransferase NeuD family)
MLIAGAGGHAKEILGLFSELNQDNNIVFFDDYLANTDKLIFDKFEIIKTELAVRNLFQLNNKFVIGVGNPKSREMMALKLQNFGGELCSIISPKANIGKYSNELNLGLNILTNVTITENVKIGVGSLIHINVTIHHDCEIGKYCEVSPSCNILGNVRIGDYCSIGAGAIILPGVVIGNNVTIGAGSVVTKSVSSNQKIKGVPAK